MNLLRNRIALAAVLVLAGTIFTAQPGHAQGVLENCEEEIKALCSTVSPGDGRLISCMYAHENYLNEKCANSIADFGDILDFVFSTIRGAMETCIGDIEKHCADTEFGGGRMMSCLSEKAADITPECKMVVRISARNSRSRSSNPQATGRMLINWFKN